ncbi:specificity determinant HsdS [Pseudomonas fluorescens]|nr:specificity determinant HsdS [Pseudomonas fluorescens]
MCRELPIPVPPVAEQTEIVRRVDQLFAFADQLEAKVISAQSRINHLTQSILAKAFRGELVPQDPNDEAASMLLERIKAQRAAAPKAKRGRKASA